MKKKYLQNVTNGKNLEGKKERQLILISVDRQTTHIRGNNNILIFGNNEAEIKHIIDKIEYQEIVLNKK